MAPQKKVMNGYRHTVQEYLDGGLLNAWKEFDFLEALTDGIVSAEKMDVSENNQNMPAIFTGRDFAFDILDDKDLKNIDEKFINSNFAHKF